MRLILLIILAVFDLSLKPSYRKSEGLNHQINNTKQDAFSVLNKKCNYCHADKKNRSVFTLENMNIFAEAIEYQVFVKKKMPKGRKNKLTLTEEKMLRTWIESLDNT